MRNISILEDFLEQTYITLILDEIPDNPYRASSHTLVGIEDQFFNEGKIVLTIYKACRRKVYFFIFTGTIIDKMFDKLPWTVPYQEIQGS